MFVRYSPVIISILLCFAVPAWSTIIHVPAQEPTIQAGINAAFDGDTVLVAPDTFFENINFHKKGIIVASHYIINNNIAYIESTIIDGRFPVHPDTASCVLIVSDTAASVEDSSAAIIGFTITAGKGTKWQDEHGAGLYREGGGILVQYLSPRILHNIIKGNEAIDNTGVTSAGGGAIRCGDGGPRIQNNVIVANQGLYGGGIVLNYTGAIIKNNIVACNAAGGAYGGGGGIWSYSNGILPKIVENNTIVYNAPGGTAQGGGLRLWSSDITLRNNIIWANTNQQIYRNGGTVLVTYCDVQGGYAGEGNIDTDPFLAGDNYFLSDSSPCIDAGDGDPLYNDPEDVMNPGYAAWPSLGGLRNDIGVYGGPGRTLLSDFLTAVHNPPITGVPGYGCTLDNHPNPFARATTILYRVPVAGPNGRAEIFIYDVSGRLVKRFPDQASPAVWDGVDDRGRLLGSGVYLCCLRYGDVRMIKQMVIAR